jgi:uncharacterized protein DUF3419
MILKTGWIEEAVQQPVAFSQVREDPRLDLELIQSLGDSLSVVMVASGGCTAAALVGSGRIKNLQLVDLNCSQLALTMFKLHLLRHQKPVERLRLLGHAQMTPKTRLERVNRVLEEMSLPLDIFGDPSIWSHRGLDHCGRYELLFAELRRRLGPEPKRPEPASRAEVFARVMSQENLHLLFGPEATSNRATDFWRHFHQQTECALANDSDSRNPFLSQMLAGDFGQVRYDWLDLEAPVTWPKLECHKESMLNFLSTVPAGSQDFIHLSNILDWLAPEQARQTLSQAARALRIGGVLVVRQLNSTLSIRELADSLEWDESLSTKLLAQDRSFFYRDVHVARRIA